MRSKRTEELTRRSDYIVTVSKQRLKALTPSAASLTKNIFISAFCSLGKLVSRLTQAKHAFLQCTKNLPHIVPTTIYTL